MNRSVAGRIGTAVLLSAAAAVPVSAAAATVARPAVSHVSPSLGSLSGGTRVTVTGHDFRRVRAVRFGTTPGTSIRVLSASKLTVTAPRHRAGMVDVRVTTSAGVSAARVSDHFRYVAPPVVTAMTPAYGPRTGGTRVKITGRNFVSVRSVRFGASVGRALKVVSNTTVYATAPAHAAGRVHVQVVTGFGRSPGSTHDQFTFRLTSTRSFTATEAPLPADARPTDQRALLESVACPVATTCVATGTYTNTAGTDRPLIATRQDGTWSVAAAPIPGDANAPGAQGAYLDSLACADASSCVTDGTYFDADFNAHPFIDTYENGNWTSSPIVDEAGVPTASVGVDAVACLAASRCIAVGDNSFDSEGHRKAVVVTQSGGVWTSHIAPVPPNADATNPDATLHGADCVIDVSCTAVGVYTDTGGNRRPFVLSFDGTTWTPAALPAPSDAAADGYPGLSDVSCPTSTSCVAVGSYDSTTAKAQREMVTTLTDGRWTSVRAPRPPGIPSGLSLGLLGVTCSAAGTCVVVGQLDDRFADYHGGVIDTLRNGRWTSTVAPVRGTQDPFAYQTGLRSAACDVSGACVAVGFAPGSQSTGGALIDDLLPDGWSASSAPSLPDSKSTWYEDLRAVAAVPGAGFVAVGGYDSSSTDVSGLLIVTSN